MNQKRFIGMTLFLLMAAVLLLVFGSSVAAQADTTAEANKQLATRYIEEVWSMAYHPQIRELVSQGKKLSAIKLYRELKGVELREANDAIEGMLANPNPLDQLLAANYVPHPSVYDMRDTSELLHQAMPKLEVTIEEIIAEGNVVAVRMMLHGQHTDLIYHIPPSGREVELSLSSFMHFRDGKIEEEWFTVDWLDFFIQIGATAEMFEELF